MSAGGIACCVHGCRLTTQAQRPGARDTTIATATLSPGSLQRMVRRHGWSPILSWWPNDSLPQNLLHRFSLGQLIDELVQVAKFSHQWIFDFFYAHTAHHSLDKRAIWMNAWCLGKKGFKIVFLFDLLLQSRLVITRQPANNLVHFLLGAFLAFRFLNVQRIDPGKLHRENAVQGFSYRGFSWLCFVFLRLLMVHFTGDVRRRLTTRAQRRRPRGAAIATAA